jgi:hypothetical protein
VSTLLDRLKELGEAASERPWSSALGYGAIVTQGNSTNPAAGADDREYYGGALVGESIGRRDREYIVAVVNAAPDLVAVVEEVALEHRLANGQLANPEYCSTCRALAPLLREVQP